MVKSYRFILIEEFDMNHFEKKKFTVELDQSHIRKRSETATLEAYRKRGYRVRNIGRTAKNVALSPMERPILEENLGRPLDQLVYGGVPDQIHFRFKEDADPNNLTSDDLEDVYFLEEKNGNTGLKSHQLKWMFDNNDIQSKIAVTQLIDHERYQEEKDAEGENLE